MTDESVFFKDGFKYQLERDFHVQTKICPPYGVEDDFIRLNPDGFLIVLKGYASDGSSGPAIDTPESMRGAFAHDPLYQLMRKRKISQSWRPIADKLYYDLCVEDGMWKPRAWLRYRALVRAGGPSASEEARKPELSAP